MPCHKKHKMFLAYCRLSVKEGLFDATVDVQEGRFGNYSKIYIENAIGVIKYSKLKKILRKTSLCAMNAMNFYKWKTLKTQFPLKCIFFGKKIKCLEFVQTSIDLLQSRFLEKKMRKVEKEKYQEKHLVFT